MYRAVFQTVCVALGDGELVIVSEVICIAGMCETVSWEPVLEVLRLEGSPGKVAAQLQTSGTELWQISGS